MCYNKQSSLGVWFFSLACSIFLLVRNYPNDRWLAVIFLVAGLMQIAEFFMWSDQKCGRMNHIATMFAMFILLIEPISIILGGYYLGDLNINKQKLRNVMILYLVFFGLAIIKLLFFKGKTCSKAFNGSPGHLIWDHSQIFKNIPKIFGLLVLILYYGAAMLLFYTKNNIEGGIYAIMYYLSLLISFSIVGTNNRPWKSFWCWIINIIPLAVIGIGYYYHHKKNKEEHKTV